MNRKEEIKDNKKEFETLSAAFVEIKNKFQELRAAPMDEKCNHDEKMNKIMDSVYSMISNLHDRIDKAHNNHWEYQANHKIGHIPPLVGSQMSKLLEKCDLDGDFNVAKPTIYASRLGPVFEVAYKK